MLHLTNDNRNAIASMVAHERSCKDIAEAIGCDPATISKEIKKNQIISIPLMLNQRFFVRS